MDLELVEGATMQVVANGIRLLHVHRFAPTDEAHVAKLAEWAGIEDGARIVDMGSGVGEVARLWSELQPVSFTLVNISPAQLALSPTSMAQICAHMTAVPLPPESFDAAIFVFSIGHADRAAAFSEAARLVRPGGVVFIYDMVGEGKNLGLLDYHTTERADMEAAAASAGLALELYVEPEEVGSWGRDNLESYELFFGDVRPAVWRWRL